MDGQTDGRTDERTNGMDENYIPLRHTSYAGGIINLCLCSFQFNWLNNTESTTGCGRDDTDGTSLDNTELVPSCIGAVNRQSKDPQSQRRYTFKSTAGEMSSSIKQTTSDGLSYIRQSFQKRKFSNEATAIIMASWRLSTQKQYATDINRWVQFCDKRKTDRFYPSVDSVIEFLTEMFRAGYKQR